MHGARDSGVDVPTRCSGWCSPRAASAAGTGRVSVVRTRTRRCRRRQFLSGRMGTGRARGIQRPRVTAHVLARAPDRPHPNDTCRTPMSRRLMGSMPHPSDESSTDITTMASRRQLSLPTFQYVPIYTSWEGFRTVAPIRVTYVLRLQLFHSMKAHRGYGRNESRKDRI